MTWRISSTTASAAALAMLVMLIALLSGHCPRPVLAPHPVTAASAMATASSTMPAARPTDHSCTTEMPAAISAPPAGVVEPPPALLAPVPPHETAGPEPVPLATVARAPPPRPLSPSISDLCVLRV